MLPSKLHSSNGIECAAVFLTRVLCNVVSMKLKQTVCLF